MRTTPLDGLWSFWPDLDPKYHPAVEGKGHTFAAPDLDRRHWTTVPVPGVWQKYGERYDIFEGVCWFAREFDLDDAASALDGRIRFEGVNYSCHVYLNGTWIGRHDGGYTPFAVETGDALRPGRNVLAVRVDNRSLNTVWPHVLGYFNYGGIHRPVTLELFDAPSFDTLHLDAKQCGAGGRLSVSGTTRPVEPDLRVRLRCGAAHAECVVKEDGAFRMETPIRDAALWSPDAPALHDVLVEIVRGEEITDSRDERVGFRTVEVGDDAVLLNGDAVTLHGVCYVYDSPVAGLAWNDAQAEGDVRLMKDAGVNAVRCHYPMDERFYALCDREGLLVWIEPPVYCYHPADDATGTLYADEHARAVAVATVTEMIASARNHPSVVLYGIGNECNTRNAEAEPFFRLLAETTRALDPTRLVSYAALYGNVGPLAGLVDVLGVNSYWGWYDKIFGGKGLAPDGTSADDGECAREPVDLAPMRTMLAEVMETRSDLLLFLTEFGADSVPGNFSASRDLWSENYHADLLREILDLARAEPRIAGTFPFCFTDYRDPSKHPNGYWNEFNLKGLVTYERRPRLAWHAVREAYAEDETGKTP